MNWTSEMDERLRRLFAVGWGAWSIAGQMKLPARLVSDRLAKLGLRPVACKEPPWGWAA